MKKLYIIGNGFDRYHGLPSRYADFYLYVEENYPELLEKLNRYFDFRVDDYYLWSHFEQDLCHYDHGGFLDTYNHIDVSSESFRLSEFYGLEDEVTEESENLVEEIREAFVTWVESFNFAESSGIAYKPLKLDAEARFINFNYTDTLEELYAIPKNKILYIHNNANAYAGGLIFGHGQRTDHAEVPTFDEHSEPTRTSFTDAENASRVPFFAFQKDTKAVLKQHQGWYNTLRDIEEVIILGHSLGKVDWPYFRAVFKLAPHAQWKLSYYGDKERPELQHRATSLIRRADVQMITFSELL